MEEYKIQDNIRTIVFIKRNIEETKNFTKFLDTGEKLDVKAIKIRAGLLHHKVVREFTLNSGQVATLYMYFKSEVERLEKLLDKYTDEEKAIADDYINKAYDKACEILY